MWGEFKSRFGWKNSAFLVEWAGYGSYPLMVLSRRLAPGFSFSYVPWGPELPAAFPSEYRYNALAELAGKLKPLLTASNVFLRFEPPWHIKTNEELPSNNELKAAGLRKAAAAVQAPDTVIINLENSLEEILAAMKSKWRYNISLAGKKGVQVKTCGINELEIFYNLLSETAQRDGISVHSLSYYNTLFEICSSRSDLSLRLYTANHDGDTIAAIIVLFRRDYATYLYGASSGLKRNLMSPYALQWKAVQDAKDAGCKHYDLFGIPPDDNPGHPMAGLYLFKTGFGGQIVHRSGTWDYAFKPAVYYLFSIAEGIRKKLMNRKKTR